MTKESTNEAQLPTFCEQLATKLVNGQLEQESHNLPLVQQIELAELMRDFLSKLHVSITTFNAQSLQQRMEELRFLYPRNPEKRFATFRPEGLLILPDMLAIKLTPTENQLYHQYWEGISIHGDDSIAHLCLPATWHWRLARGGIEQITALQPTPKITGISTVGQRVIKEALMDFNYLRSSTKSKNFS
jgi:hypothetical protein